MYLAFLLASKYVQHVLASNQDDPIMRCYDSVVDYLLIYFCRCRTCWCSIFVHLCHIHRYVFLSYCGSREIESL